MTIKEQYRFFLSQLEGLYPKSEAENICSLLFENKAGITRADMIKEPESILDLDTIQAINDCLPALLQHKPVQYITGEAWFYKMKLKATPAVLIPRPETEEMADMVIRYLKGKPGAQVLDIGTGSGCISIAIKKNCPDAEITAIDVSMDALAIAKENAQKLQTEIAFLEINFLEESSWKLLHSFDVIVSNPPYIPESEKEKLDKNVTAFEPHTALFVTNSRPLVFYEMIALFGRSYLKNNGMMFMETHEDLAEDVEALFQNDFYKSTVVKDISGKNRFVIATRHSPLQ